MSFVTGALKVGREPERVRFKVRIYCLLNLNLEFFYELCDFPQIVLSHVI